jgi:hypothetical protein
MPFQTYILLLILTILCSTKYEKQHRLSRIIKSEIDFILQTSQLLWTIHYEVQERME